MQQLNLHTSSIYNIHIRQLTKKIMCDIFYEFQLSYIIFIPK